MFDLDLRDLVVPQHLLERETVLRWFPRRPKVRILVVADTSVSFTSGFGIGKVIDLIRENVDGYVRFEVDLARLGTESSTLNVDATPGPKEAKYTGFRFSSQVGGQPVLHDYDQVWCFGFAPGNDGSVNDDNIWNDPHASTDADLAVLTQWMNTGGGVLAMGDHHYLGASMCARIPRVGTMRRWTNLQQVPPISGPNRHVTNRPQNTAQDAALTASPSTIPTSAQSDSIPQTIEWRRYGLDSRFLLERRYRPHPVLCGGRLGVIDVLPDHQHEGWVYEDAEVKLDGTYDFDGYTGVDYPKIGGVRPTPEVIAWGHTLADPPYEHAGGDSPGRRFGVIGAYDGARIDHGRVLVDSTWHHWMDLNLAGLEAETPDTEYDKIVRYFRNAAVWLSRKEHRQAMLTYASFFTVLTPRYFEEFAPHRPVLQLGQKALDVLERETSACMVRDWIDIMLPDSFLEVIERPPLPIPEPCWSCPPIDLARAAALGGVMQAFLPVRAGLQKYERPGKDIPAVSPKSVAATTERGARAGLQMYMGLVRDNAYHLAHLAKRLELPERAKAAD